ncbi:MAG: hypothetical protein GX851_08685 [Clostridiales bacterium]|nr:hypothetical protein [Clostridiales bacterium]
MQIRNITVQIPTYVGGEVVIPEAGVMGEHNATKLIFNVPEEYIDENYRYYVEYSVPASEPVRSEYLPLSADGKAEFSVPAALTLLAKPVCWFNVVYVDAGETEQVIKPTRVMMSFTPSPNADMLLDEIYSSDINRLLHSIESGEYRGDAGRGIESIVKTGETLSVTYTDATTDVFTVPDGSRGESGADGVSAYEAAVAGGFTGTELEFNAILAGVGDIKAALALIVSGNDNTTLGGEGTVEGGSSEEGDPVPDDGTP